jgi:hypothetical protein
MQNFGKITNAFNGILVEGLVSKDANSKQMFKKYIKTIRENEALKTQFMVYNNIEDKIETNEFKANLFLQENIALLNKFSKKELFEANFKLVDPILFEKETTYPNEKLHEDIAKLIFTEKNSKNIDSIVEATASIIDYMKNNTEREIKESIDLPNSMLTTIMVDKYNEKYSTLDESEKEVIKVLIESDDEKKKEVYSSMLRECIDLINEKLKESTLEAKDKLLSVKDKLLNDKQEISEDFVKNISKLVELRTNLK